MFLDGRARRLFPFVPQSLGPARTGCFAGRVQNASDGGLTGLACGIDCAWRSDFDQRAGRNRCNRGMESSDFDVKNDKGGKWHHKQANLRTPQSRSGELVKIA
jgi:hypothetical protein